MTSSVSDRPDISEQLRASEAHARGEVTLEDVAESAKKAAEDVGDDEADGGRKTGKTSAGAGVSKGAEKAAERATNRLMRKSVEGLAAEQEATGRRAAVWMGREVRTSIAPASPGVTSTGTLRLADLEPLAKRRRA